MLGYLALILMGAVWGWWEYRLFNPKPPKSLDCATGCGAQLLPGIHFNAKVEGHPLPNGEMACTTCYLKIWDEVDEAIGIPAPKREEEEPPCIQATPETRKMVAKMTSKWPVEDKTPHRIRDLVDRFLDPSEGAGDDLSNLNAEFEANLAAEKAEAVAREEGRRYTVPPLYCKKCVALNSQQCCCSKAPQERTVPELIRTLEAGSYPKTRCAWCNGESLGNLCNACILYGQDGLADRLLKNAPYRPSHDMSDEEFIRYFAHSNAKTDSL
jgi:hypothetical protein